MIMENVDHLHKQEDQQHSWLVYLESECSHFRYAVMLPVTGCVFPPQWSPHQHTCHDHLCVMLDDHLAVLKTTTIHLFICVAVLVIRRLCFLWFICSCSLNPVCHMSSGLRTAVPLLTFLVLFQRPTFEFHVHAHFSRVLCFSWVCKWSQVKTDSCCLRLNLRLGSHLRTGPQARSIHIPNIWWP